MKSVRLFLKDACLFDIYAPTEDDVLQLPPAKKRKLTENASTTIAPDQISTSLATNTSTDTTTCITSQNPTDRPGGATHQTPQISPPDNWNKKQQRKKKRKKYQNDLADLFFSSNWKIRGSSAQLYDKARSAWKTSFHSP